MAQQIRLIFGVPYSVGKDLEDILDEFEVKDLDTGRTYPGSEKFIGDAGLPAKYAIHTKAAGWKPGAMTYDRVLESAAESFKALGVESVETYYLHSPDPATPISETLEAIQKLYLEGRFRHFGLSNFLPKQVQEVYDYATSKNYILPTVYEGHYNPVGRHAETELLPLLRKLHIRYYAYGALAGGFLTKSPGFFTTAEATQGTRWDASNGLGQLYNSLYNKPSFIAALGAWDAISQESGISKADLSYRWVAHNSSLSGELGDGVIVGAGKPAQLRGALEGLRMGPLEEWVVERIDAVWEAVKEDAILDNFNRETKA